MANYIWLLTCPLPLMNCILFPRICLTSINFGLWSDYSFTQFSNLNTLISAGFRSTKVMLLVNVLNIFPLALDQKGINFIFLVIVVSLPYYRFEWREPQSNGRHRATDANQSGMINFYYFLITNNLDCY